MEKDKIERLYNLYDVQMGIGLNSFINLVECIERVIKNE